MFLSSSLLYENLLISIVFVVTQVSPLIEILPVARVDGLSYFSNTFSRASWVTR
jgi:hypothetical protein